MSCRGWISRFSLWSPCLIGVLVCGCNLEPSGLPAMTLYPVRGSVKLSGDKPLTSGRVVFVQEKTAITFPATIASDGSFVVKGSTGDGLPAGTFRVRIEPDETKLTRAQANPAGRKNALPFPAAYLDEQESGLQISIKEGENPPLELVLAKNPGRAGKSTRETRP
jgi:hypothetical protein